MNLGRVAMPQHAVREAFVVPTRLVGDALQGTDTQDFVYNLALCRISQDAAQQQLVLAQSRCNAALTPGGMATAGRRKLASAGQLSVTAQHADNTTFVQCVLDSVASGEMQ